MAPEQRLHLSIISVRLGELSTWQCVQAWLQ
jgi:hypothetical protein